MPIMSDRIFFSLALLCLAVTSAHSYGSYADYGPRDESLRQVRRCPTCPPDCPESLASPWYGSPTVYGQPVPYKAANQEHFDGPPQHSSYRANQAHLRDSPYPYGNPYFGGSNPYARPRCPCSSGGCNQRSPRSGNASPEAATVAANSPDAHESFDPAGSFDSMEPRGLLPYYPRSSATFIPESYRGSGADFESAPVDNHRVSRHYGNSYKDRNPSIDDQSLGSNPPNWNGAASYPQHPAEEFENPEKVAYEDRLKAIETPSQKKVFVVYRADADPSSDDEDLETSLMNASRQQQQQQQQTMDALSEAANPMTDLQLEEVVRRAVAAATRRNLYARHQPRGVYNNEQERYQEESYNPRRPYNDALYQRFNAEEAIDRQERRKLYRTGFGPSEVVYSPNMRYNPYVLPGENNYQNSQAQKQYYMDGPQNNAREMATWEDQGFSSNVEQNADEETSELGQEHPMTILDELRDISREETNKNRGEEGQQKSFDAQEFATAKRETDSEEMEPPPINYRTAARTATEEPIFSGGEENGQDESEEQTSETSSNSQETDVEDEKLKMNPDLMEDMEIPPTGESEGEVQLSYESSDNSTPSPN